MPATPASRQIQSCDPFRASSRLPAFRRASSGRPPRARPFAKLTPLAVAWAIPPYLCLSDRSPHPPHANGGRIQVAYLGAFAASRHTLKSSISCATGRRPLRQILGLRGYTVETCRANTDSMNVGLDVGLCCLSGLFFMVSLRSNRVSQQTPKPCSSPKDPSC